MSVCGALSEPLLYTAIAVKLYKDDGELKFRGFECRVRYLHVKERYIVVPWRDDNHDILKHFCLCIR